MRAVGIIQRRFEVGLEDVHLARVRLVFTAVYTLLRSGRLSLTSLGRAIANRTSHKHGIKRVDRLLGNTKLHSERITFFRALAHRLIASESRPVIIVDWTAVTPRLWALVAAVSFEGRALTVYAETHPISEYLKPYVNSAFLHRLNLVLPPRCAPIIVADAGFRSPFMKLVEQKGWDYVVRLRGPARIRHKYGRGWTRLTFLFGLAGRQPKDFGHVEIEQRTRFVTRLVGAKRVIQHRKHYCRVRRSTVVRRERRAAQQPWILATSLALTPAHVVAVYKLRMQIEETFRDAKSTRFGMSLVYARTKSVDRANVLLLLAAFAHAFSILLGLAAEAARLQRLYQANTVRHRRVFSLAMLGRLVSATGDHLLLATALEESSWRALGARLGQAAP